ncbi:MULTISPECIES: Gfo/Idh/MocA family protein [unclassified Roseovarius]|uniref:Gfo/Idh/MocA family protein n=1 Tax=unclassified Roseovarius TaxID=2614913 RepID=UPI00273D5298|nr:Gfo/Idh/MocA family oxidoreductase [Roseovarius sp. MMSF_3350]
MSVKRLVLLGGAHVHLPDHLDHLHRRGWRVTQVHDRDPARQNRLATELDARPVSPNELGQSDCVGALVCSETAHHEADISAALRAGLDVFSEKPLAGSASAAKRCADLANAEGRRLHTGYFFRTNRALRCARDLVKDGALGRISEARMRFSHDGGYADWLDLDCWMTDPALACYGGFADEAVHAIDALQWLLGPIDTAHAVTGNVLGWPVDDHGAGVLTFRNGATGLVEAGWTDKTMRLELDIVGDVGWLNLNDGVLTAGRRSEARPTTEMKLAPLDAGEGIEPFLDVLEGKDAMGLVPVEDAVRVNEVLDRMDLNLGETAMAQDRATT